MEPDEEDIRANLLLDKILGAEVHIVDIQPGESKAEAEERSIRMGREHMARLEAEGHKRYEVPIGGASPVGSVGFIEGFTELMEQAEQMIGKDRLSAGRALKGAKVPVISINVSLKDDGYPKRCAALANESLKVLGIEPMVEQERDVRTDLNYYHPGYEIPSESASEAIRLLAETEGLLVDPVYTGKAFAGMLDYIRTGKVEPGSNVVFLHTGGATALFAEKEILGKLF